MGRGKHFGIASAYCLHIGLWKNSEALPIAGFSHSSSVAKENHDKYGSWFTASSYPHIDLGDSSCSVRLSCPLKSAESWSWAVLAHEMAEFCLQSRKPMPQDR